MKNYKLVIAAAITVVVSVLNGIGQTNDLNYQGDLNLSGQPANGRNSSKFRLYRAGFWNAISVSYLFSTQ